MKQHHARYSYIFTDRELVAIQRRDRWTSRWTLLAAFCGGPADAGSLFMLTHTVVAPVYPPTQRNWATRPLHKADRKGSRVKRLDCPAENGKLVRVAGTIVVT